MTGGTRLRCRALGAMRAAFRAGVVAAIGWGMTGGGAPAAQAAVVHLDSALRYVQADVNEWSDPPPSRYESSALGPVDWWLYVDNMPSNVRASVGSRQNTDLGVSDDGLYLRGTFIGDPYWYWYIQRESYAVGAQIDFTLDVPASYTLAWQHTCYYWRAQDGYCPIAYEIVSLTGGPGTGVPGRLERGSYRLALGIYDDNPWNGVQTVNFAFTLQAEPVPEPASPLLALTAFAALAAIGRRGVSRDTRRQPPAS